MHKKRMAAILCLMTALALLFYSRETAEGVRVALKSCAGVLIPSLFPFMVLASLLGLTEYGAMLSRLLAPFLRLLGVPRTLGCTLFMSLVGGYPVGARMVADQLARGELDQDNASRALCCCVNAGPSFLISAIGAGMLGSPAAGVLLLCTQAISALLLAALSFRGASIPLRESRCAFLHPAQAFVEAVRTASAGVLSICAFVTAFSALTSLLDACGLLPAISGMLGSLYPGLFDDAFCAAALHGILEVTGGTLAACRLGGPRGLLLSAFLISFSSVSIIFQAKSWFPAACGVSFGRFYRSRLLHGLITCLLCVPGMRLLPPATQNVAIMHGAPLPAATPAMLISGSCLIAMCSLLLLVSPREASGIRHAR